MTDPLFTPHSPPVRVARIVCDTLIPFLAGALIWQGSGNGWAGLAVAAVASGFLAAIPRRARDGAIPVATSTSQADTTAERERVARLCHDIKGTLSPALLLAEQLSLSQDEGSRDKADTIAMSIENASRMVSKIRTPQ